MIVDGTDYLAVRAAAADAVARARSGGGPSLIECKAGRFFGHMEGFDGQGYRGEGEVDVLWSTQDPLQLFVDKASFPEDVVSGVDVTVDAAVELAMAIAPESGSRRSRLDPTIGFGGCVMQVQTTSSPEEFARHAGDWLTRDPAHNNVLLVHALDPNGVPPGQGDPVFAWVTDDAGEVVGAGFDRLPYRMPLSAMPPEAARTLVDHLVTVLPGLEGVAGPADTAKEFAARWSEMTGRSANRERDQWLMVCTETTRPTDAGGGP